MAGPPPRAQAAPPAVQSRPVPLMGHQTRRRRRARTLTAPPRLEGPPPPFYDRLASRKRHVVGYDLPKTLQRSARRAGWMDPACGDPCAAGQRGAYGALNAGSLSVTG